MYIFFLNHEFVDYIIVYVSDEGVI